MTLAVELDSLSDENYCPDVTPSSLPSQYGDFLNFFKDSLSVSSLTTLVVPSADESYIALRPDPSLWDSNETYKLNYRVAYSTSTSTQEFVDRAIHEAVYFTVANPVCNDNADHLILPDLWPNVDSSKYYFISGQAQAPLSTYSFIGAGSSITECLTSSSLSPLTIGDSVFTYSHEN